MRKPVKACAANPWYIYNSLILNTPNLDLVSDAPPDHLGCCPELPFALLLRNKDRLGSYAFNLGRYLSKISFGTRIRQRRGVPSVEGGSSHSNVSATTGSCMILSSGCMSRWGRQPAWNVVPELPLYCLRSSRVMSSPIIYNRERSGNGLFGFPPLPWTAEVLVGLLRGSLDAFGIRLKINGLQIGTKLHNILRNGRPRVVYYQNTPHPRFAP